MLWDDHQVAENNSDALLIGNNNNNNVGGGDSVFSGENEIIDLEEKNNLIDDED